MAAADVYRKTERGLAEIKDRKLKLNPRVRSMLILIDGAQPELMLKEDGARIGAPADFLQQLLAHGLIERMGVAPAPGAPAAEPPAADEFTRFRNAKNFMNTTIVEALGIKSFFFTMKLERAGVVADLVDLVEPYRAALAKASSPEEADVMAAHLREMLGIKG
jgi:hypothetical protein